MFPDYMYPGVSFNVERPSSNHNVIFELSMFDLVYAPGFSVKNQSLNFCAVAPYVHVPS